MSALEGTPLLSADIINGSPLKPDVISGKMADKHDHPHQSTELTAVAVAVHLDDAAAFEAFLYERLPLLLTLVLRLLPPPPPPPPPTLAACILRTCYFTSLSFIDLFSLSLSFSSVRGLRRRQVQVYRARRQDVVPEIEGN